jgi:hypothetical protein
MYSPTQGRFVTPDPTGFKAGDVDLYRFVDNNPTDATDPTGLAPIPAVAKKPSPLEKNWYRIERLVLQWQKDTPLVEMARRQSFKIRRSLNQLRNNVPDALLPLVLTPLDAVVAFEGLLARNRTNLTEAILDALDEREKLVEELIRSQGLKPADAKELREQSKKYREDTLTKHDAAK